MPPAVVAAQRLPTTAPLCWTGARPRRLVAWLRTSLRLPDMQVRPDCERELVPAAVCKCAVVEGFGKVFCRC